jgi:hypothetical protein
MVKNIPFFLYNDLVPFKENDENLVTSDGNNGKFRGDSRVTADLFVHQGGNNGNYRKFYSPRCSTVL